MSPSILTLHESAPSLARHRRGKLCTSRTVISNRGRDHGSERMSNAKPLIFLAVDLIIFCAEPVGAWNYRDFRAPSAGSAQRYPQILWTIGKTAFRPAV